MKRLWSSPTLRSVAVYGAAGLGFAGANLILARVLPPDEYAVVTLVMALLNLGFFVAPAGLDGVVNRLHLEDIAPLDRLDQGVDGVIPVSPR